MAGQEEPEPAVRYLASFSESAWSDDLDELSHFTVLQHLDARDLSAVRPVSRRWGGAVSRDARRLYSGLARRTLHPYVSDHFHSRALGAAPSYEARWRVQCAAARAWRFECIDPPGGAGVSDTAFADLASSGAASAGTSGAASAGVPGAAAAAPPRLPRGPCKWSLPLSPAHPLFSVNALRSFAAHPALLASGSDGIVRIVQLGRGGAPRGDSRDAAAEAAAARDETAGGCGRDGGADDRSEDAGWGAWARGTAWPALRHAASRAAAASAGGGAAEGAHGVRASVLHEWSAHDGGMLGLSVDEPAHPDRPTTAITCAFSGATSLWRVEYRDLSRLASLPIRRLKGILASRRVRFDDLNEKSELVKRISLLGALPPATLLARLEPHPRTVVSASHEGGVAVTVGHAGLARVFTHLEALEGGGGAVDANGCVKAARTIDVNEAGVDACLLERSLGRFLVGGKDGCVGAYDLETGGRRFEFQTGATWVWCLRSLAGAGALPPTPWDVPPSSAGLGSSSSSSDSPGVGGVFGQPTTFLSGDTSGLVRVWDERVGCVACVNSDRALPPSHIVHDGEAESALAGMALVPHLNAFATSGFDGAVRLWEARTMRTLWTLPPPPRRQFVGGTQGSAELRLARCALVAPDLLACAAMDGSVKLMDFNWLRGVSTLWEGV